MLVYSVNIRFNRYEEEKATREQDSTNTQASTSKNKSSIPAITKLKEKRIPLAQRFFTQSLDKSKFYNVTKDSFLHFKLDIYLFNDEIIFNISF